ncbi:hypothetical protein NEMIN01_2044 [Nematocida minor]|uniref:uncharacterized protein n=1 Tax=Nematocida minor TaxID=1912983 RepID=UPI00221F197C|nr:uncharacterized protein NEMIN01_2044 [Nematocida minor]KAI5192480.1 hypothetical protein NEMIN01_2044 [Nematocida minor]
MNKVEAIIRIRPLSVSERSRGIQQAWHKIGNKGVIQHLNNSSQEVSAQTLLFDWVFGEDSKNDDLFSHLNSTIDESLHNVNVCLIAYGQTSSGKTHTMKGILHDNSLEKISTLKHARNTDVWGKPIGNTAEICRSDPGIIPKSLDWIFSKKENHKFSLSYVEVYNENIYDLLGDPAESLQIRESAEGEVYIKDVAEIEVQTKEEAFDLFAKGNSIRKVSATRMNRESSRSHTILKITIKKQGKKTSLVFVDLAGSERVSTANTSGATLKEGASINKSLLALTSVISKLSKKQAHIPYRDAKLTRILQPSLAGPAKTVIICAVSPVPSCIDETISTLALASRARNIEIKPAQKPKVRREDRVQIHSKIEEIFENVKTAKIKVQEIKTVMKDAECIIEQIAYQSREVENVNMKNTKNQLADILLELKTAKEEQMERLSVLSESVSHLMQQERILSEDIKPSMETAVLLDHLAEGDALIQQQREEISMLHRSKQIDDANISLAMEMDRIKKTHQREKRILQLKIAQLKSQIKLQSPMQPHG